MCYIGVLSTFCEQHGPSVLMTTTITDEPIENVVIICHSWGNILGLIVILNYGGEEDEMEKGEKKYFKE